MNIEIDLHSGFCHGVTTAIKKAEDELAKKNQLYCLGDIVHNDQEVKRLGSLGLKTIDQKQFNQLTNEKVLLRAHGEPPATYMIASKNNIQLIDATCPVVLQLQKRIKKIYEEQPECQIVIFGKKGHAEVIGLVGQTNGHAIVVQTLEEVKQLDFSKNIYLFSQTTMSLDEFNQIIALIQSKIIHPTKFYYFDTICRQVANRLPNIENFAKSHDVVIFVSGLKSSNGKILFEACKRVNPYCHLVTNHTEIKKDWFTKANSVGICGATSTPKWLMDSCAQHIKNITAK